MGVLDLIAVLLALVLCVPAGVVALQVALALGAPPPGDDSAPGSGGAAPSVAVLMPAHDEATGVEAAIASVLAQLGPADRLLVVADNCSDDTAGVARRAGAEVVERRDTQRRGKGYALDFGVRHLALAPPQVVVIVDADCTLAPAALKRVVARCHARGRPAQALYLMRSAPGAGAKAHVAEFAWIVRNHVRPLGWHRVGWPCQLMGTGMAFPWGLIQGGQLASGHIVEDMQLGLDLARAGRAPLFCPEALVASSFPADAEGATAQRTRWEHGHLNVITTQGLPMLAAALLRADAALAAMALDVCVPPLASLVLLQTAGAVAALAWLTAGGSAWPLALALLGLVALALSIAVAWRRFATHVVTAAEWLSIPRYVLGKVPMYLRMFWRRQTEWVRAKRDGKP
jgi:cellulose synthase/poly-beta-1,6-N-acetylglucosamine synthase-like glycosyltransferase